MNDNLKHYLTQFPKDRHLNHTREYVQWLILKAVDDAGFRRDLAFVGGTALRTVFKISRFSEDLDFSLVSGAKLDAKDLSSTVAKAIQRCNLQITIAKLKSEGNVISFFMKFQDLLYPLGISAHKDQPLSIKLEIDTKPPKGWGLEEYFFADPVMFWVNHFDLPSLFAGKLHALLFRGYDKGRDIYDLIFFLKKKVSFNMTMFKNAAHQTHPEKNYASSGDVFKDLASKLKQKDEKKLKQDIAPFMLDPEDERFISCSTAIQLLIQGGYIKG
ncbi:nucleotidyl transferase AbiEii/AbiGii toxin family protein [Elusimicrobiota bacterium]